MATRGPRLAKAGKDGFGACSLKIKIIQGNYHIL